jgi:hypothetical protein
MSSPEHDAVPRWLPSPLALVLAAIAVVLVLVGLAHGLTDADYFWHLTTGRLIVESGSVPNADPFSFTYAGQPWTLHEWLGEVLIYLSVTTFGGTVTSVLFGVIAFGGVALAALTARRLGAGTVATGVACVIAALVVIPYVTVRPQAFSWLLLGALSFFLVSLDASRPRRALLLIPFFVLWANLHGLYVVGLGAVALYTLFTIVGRSPMAPALGWMLVGAVGALLASMLTPAGPAGILYPLRYLEPGDWGLANIVEWQSPNFHDPANIGLLVLIVALAAVGSRGAPAWMALLAWIGVAMSLLSVRNEPLAAVWALPVIAIGLPARVRTRVRNSQAVGRRIIEMAAAALVIVAAVVIIGPQILSPAQALERSKLPVTGVDRLAQSQTDARVFAEYGWAGYVISRLHDGGGRVFVDGRNDMYPQSILEDYSQIRGARNDWSAKLDKSGATAILLPPDAPLVSAAKDSGWCETLRDDHEALLERCP